MLGHRRARDVHVRGVHHDSVIRHERWSLMTPSRPQIRQHARLGRLDVDDRVLREADLDVEAEAIGVEDVVVEADPVKDARAVREVHPVHAALPLLVEAEVEDEHLVPGEGARVVGEARDLHQLVERGRRDEALEADLALRWSSRRAARRSIDTSGSSSAIAAGATALASAFTYSMAPPRG